MSLIPPIKYAAEFKEQQHPRDEGGQFTSGGGGGGAQEEKKSIEMMDAERDKRWSDRLQANKELMERTDEAIEQFQPHTKGAVVKRPREQESHFTITAPDGSIIYGWGGNRDMPDDKHRVNYGELFSIEVKTQRQGMGTSLAKDAIQMMRLAGSDHIIMRSPNEAGRALNARLIRDGVIGEAVQVSDRSGTALHPILGGESQPKKKSSTSTPEFKAWFGDSKVVDEAGEPLVVHHGSVEKNLTRFDPRHTVEVEGAFFFSSDEDVASDYTYERAYGDIVDDEPMGEVISTYLSFQNPLEYRGGNIYGVTKPDQKIVDAVEMGKAIEMAKAKGHDSLIIRNIDDTVSQSGHLSDVYVAFDPTQIKSATGNKGSFDPDDPRINYSKWDESDHPRDDDGKFGSGGGGGDDDQSSALFVSDEHEGYQGERSRNVVVPEPGEPDSVRIFEVDASIADLVFDLNVSGFPTGQSGSGVWADYKGTRAESRWHGAGGYIAFFLDDVGEKKAKQIGRAAKAAGMTFEGGPLFGEPSVTVRKVGDFDDEPNDEKARATWQRFQKELLGEKENYSRPRMLTRQERYAKWEESDHPRDDDGKFGSGGGGKPASPSNPIKAAGFTPESRQKWQEKHRVSQRQKRTPQVQGSAEKLKSGEISQDEYLATVKEHRPIKPLGEVPDIPSYKDIVGALTENKIGTGIVGLTPVTMPDGSRELKDGDKVAARLDIPAYDNYDVWVVSLHDGSKKGGKSIGYAPTAVLDNVEFATSPKAALNIGVDKPKTTFARMHGDWKTHSPQDARARAVTYMDHPDWKQVGMNPFRHSWFYDKDDGKPIVGAEQVIQIGALVLAKNVKYAPVDDDRFAFTNEKGETSHYAKWEESKHPRDESGKFGEGGGGDTAEANLPIGKRGSGSLDSQIDASKRKDKSEKRKKAKTKAAQKREDKARAKELFDLHGEQLIKRMADAGHDAKKVAATLDSMIKWESAKARKLLEKVAADPWLHAQEKQSAATASPEFKTWFGGSKVVRDDGTPLVVHHGTTAEMGGEFAFDAGKIGSANDPGFFGRGFYFVGYPTMKPGRARGEAGYYGKNVGDFYLSLQNPLDLTSPRGVYSTEDRFLHWYPKLQEVGLGSESLDRQLSFYTGIKSHVANNAKTAKDSGGGFKAWVEHPDLTRNAAYTGSIHGVHETPEEALEHLSVLLAKSVSRNRGVDDLSFPTLSDYIRTEGLESRLTEGAQANGHDGVISGDEYIVFDPASIKSATGNQGSFDPEDPRINYAKWEESKHPRDESGKFGEGGGGADEPPFQLEQQKKKTGRPPKMFTPQEKEQMVLFRGKDEIPGQTDWIEQQEERERASEEKQEPEGQLRAKAGGETGPNGEWYPGGAFIATTDMPKLAKQKRGRAADQEVHFEPGWGNRSRPKPGTLAIFHALTPWFNYNTGELTRTGMERQGFTEEEISTYEELAQKYMDGDRWVDLIDYPLMADWGDLARMAEAGQAVPGDALEKMVGTRGDSVEDVKKALGVKDYKATAEKQSSSQPPTNEADYLSERELSDEYFANYVNEAGEKIASSRETPAKVRELPIGSWKISDARGLHGRDIMQLRILNPSDLIPSEVTESDKAADVSRYRDWMKEGKVPPPISVVETESGELKIVDGHRRWLAAEEAGMQIPAWVSPIADHPDGTKDYEGNIQKVGLTYEMVTADKPPEKFSKWDESKHPRADDGKFGEGGGGGTSKPDWSQYTGVSINSHSRKKLVDSLASEIPDGWTIYAHHMTMHAGAGEADAAGSTHELKVTHWGKNDTTIAVRVEGGPDSIADHKHITVAVSPDGVAKDSNKITEWHAVEPMGLSGAVETMQGKDTSYQQQHIAGVPFKPKKSSPTSSPEFKNWFGNSKVVNDDGSPKVVYHGTWKSFDEFKNPHAEDVSGNWHMLSESPDYASQFAEGPGGQVYPVYVKADNPLDLRSLPARRGDVRVELMNLLEDEGFDVARLNEAIPYEDDLFQHIHREGARAELARQMKERGFDSIVMPDAKAHVVDNKYEHIYADTWIVLDSTQIKSSIGNQGSFDPKDPRINYSMLTEEGHKASLYEEKIAQYAAKREQKEWYGRAWEEAQHQRDESGQFASGSGSSALQQARGAAGRPTEAGVVHTGTQVPEREQTRVQQAKQRYPQAKPMQFDPGGSIYYEPVRKHEYTGAPLAHGEAPLWLLSPEITTVEMELAGGRTSAIERRKNMGHPPTFNDMGMPVFDAQMHPSAISSGSGSMYRSPAGYSRLAGMFHAEYYARQMTLWNEPDHPRDKDGQFTSGSGQEKKPEEEKKPEPEPEPETTEVKFKVRGHGEWVWDGTEKQHGIRKDRLITQVGTGQKAWLMLYDGGYRIAKPNDEGERPGFWDARKNTIAKGKKNPLDAAIKEGSRTKERAGRFTDVEGELARRVVVGMFDLSLQKMMQQANSVPEANRAQATYDRMSEILPRVVSKLGTKAAHLAGKLESITIYRDVHQLREGRGTSSGVMGYYRYSRHSDDSGELHLTAEGIPEGDQEDVVAHEFCHAVDGPRNVYSDNPEWKRVWKKEIGSRRAMHAVWGGGKEGWCKGTKVGDVKAGDRIRDGREWKTVAKAEAGFVGRKKTMRIKWEGEQDFEHYKRLAYVMVEGNEPLPEPPLTAYAQLKASEGFAEFGAQVVRDADGAKEKFPECYALWEKWGLVE